MKLSASLAATQPLSSCLHYLHNEVGTIPTCCSSDEKWVTTTSSPKKKNSVHMCNTKNEKDHINQNHEPRPFPKRSSRGCGLRLRSWCRLHSCDVFRRNQAAKKCHFSAPRYIKFNKQWSHAADTSKASSSIQYQFYGWNKFHSMRQETSKERIRWICLVRCIRVCSIILCYNEKRWGYAPQSKWIALQFFQTVSNQCVFCSSNRPSWRYGEVHLLHC